MIEIYVEEGQEPIKFLPKSSEFGFFTWFRILRDNIIEINYKIAIWANPYANTSPKIGEGFVYKLITNKRRINNKWSFTRCDVLVWKI